MSARAGSRLATGLQVVLATVLAVAVALLAIEVADRWYFRADLSAGGRNTLDPVLVELVESVPGEVRIDVFRQPLQPPYDAVAAAAQQRTLAALELLSTARRDKVRVVDHPPADPAGTAAARRELGVEGENVLVVSVGERRAVLDLFGDVAAVDWGNPTAPQLRYLAERGIRPAATFGPAAPPRLVEVRPLEAVARALAEAGRGEPVLVCFTTGAGEPGLESTLTNGLEALARALRRAGFEVEPWDPAAGPAPEACGVVAAVAPTRPWRADERARIEELLARGGRLLAGLHADAPRGEGTLAELLARHGIELLPGAVAMPIRGPGGELVEGHPAVHELLVGEGGLSHTHPITEPLVRHDRRVRIGFPPPLEIRPQPQGGEVRPLVASPRAPEAWIDLPPHDDFALSPGEEARARIPLAATARWTTPADGGAGPLEARIVALPASAISQAYLSTSDANRDLARNAFRWLAGREARVSVEPRSPEVARLDLARGGEAAALTWIAGAGLPGAALAAALAVWWRRRR